ncbi:hypothetical protein HBI40_170540 [Parastagonospora nodorum]|nr:hypothetical protein HBI41_200770 [Parastagonospora nodorum]KAH6280087.1 hypothetical protein HBI40_170540 [Parastagonospora nodorum]
MIDDANFVGGRLRLTAFLRVVEGDIAQSPSRLKRRAAPIKQPDSIEPNPIGAPHPSDSIIFNAFENRQENVSAEVFAHAGTIFNLPRSPTTIGLGSGLQNGKDTKSFDSRRTPAKATKATKKQIARIAKVKESFSTYHKPQEKRKRRLPGKGLTLFRTTTSDGGLPEPGDAHEASPLAIGDMDPINDSQMINDRRSHLHTSYPFEQIARSITATTTTPRPFLPPIKSQQHYRAGLEFVADGFEAHELKLSPPRRPRRRERTVRRQTKTITMVNGLILAGSLLPPPGLQDVDSFVPQGDSTGRSRRVINTVESPLAADDCPDQSIELRTSVTNDQVQCQQAKRSERAVNSQLASITAPVRRDTESSENDTSSEECSLGSDPEDEVSVKDGRS